MPRLTNRSPQYRHHKASGQAVVTLNGHDVYLGPYGTGASKREYDRVLGEYLARGRQLEAAADTRRVADVIKGYWDFASGYYSGPQCRTELGSFRLALGVLRRLYGETLARNFGPVALQTVRDAMIKLDWSRSYVNKQVGRLKRCFKWAASQELIPPTIFHGLQAVGGLRRGKTDARETDPVKPVPDAWVEATIPHVSRQVAGLIRLQWASGMRPGEAVIMRGCDLDTSGKVWLYTPEWHKTEHHGHDRPIFLGPQAQDVIRPFLKPDLTASRRGENSTRREAANEWRARLGKERAAELGQWLEDPRVNTPTATPRAFEPAQAIHLARPDIRAFVRAIYEPEDVIEIRRLPSARSTWHRAAEVEEIVLASAASNGEGENVYVSVNPRRAYGRRGNAGVGIIRCVFLDFDERHLNAIAPAEQITAVRRRIEGARLPEPTAVVFSGHGVHVYWRLAARMSSFPGRRVPKVCPLIRRAGFSPRRRRRNWSTGMHFGATVRRILPRASRRCWTTRCRLCV
jgi:integrase